MASFEIRCCSLSEVDLLLDWAAAEGWNPGLEDCLPFLVADPEGYLIGIRDGRPIAAISAVRYLQQYAFLGLYLVVPEFRRQGLGRQMWDAAIRRVEGYTVGLDGVVAQQANYRKSGFTLAHRNIRFEGKAPDVASGMGLVDIRSIPLSSLDAYDSAHFGAPRHAFLAAWCRTPGHLGRAVVTQGELRGFAVIRPCRRGHKFGPLFAADEATAESLFLGLSQSVAGQDVFLDVPEPNPMAIRLAERWGFRPAFETARMYLGQPPEVNLQEVFAVTTFELG